MSDKQTSFERFSRGERIQHLLILGTFSVLALTGIPQKYATLGWAQTVVELMGGITAMRVIHRIFALALGSVCIYHVVRGLAVMRERGGAFAMRPSLQDFRDLFHNIGYFLGRKTTRPRFGRFSYIEKFDYWAIAWGMTSMAVSGMILWFPSIATRLLPGVWVLAAKQAHSGEALLAVAAVALWHMYYAHLSPRVFPFNASMFTGKISEHEMMAEHALEYEQRTGQRVPEHVLQPRQLSWFNLGVSASLGALLIVTFASLLHWGFYPPAPTIPAWQSQFGNRQRVERPQATPIPPAAAVLWTERPATAPTADFAAVAVAGGVQFTSLTQGEVASWQWDFGDGATSQAQHPLHAYSTCPNGRCTVSLTVCGPGGCATETKAGYVQAEAVVPPMEVIARSRSGTR